MTSAHRLIAIVLIWFVFAVLGRTLAGSSTMSGTDSLQDTRIAALLFVAAGVSTWKVASSDSKSA